MRPSSKVYYTFLYYMIAIFHTSITFALEIIARCLVVYFWNWLFTGSVNISLFGSKELDIFKGFFFISSIMFLFKIPLFTFLLIDITNSFRIMFHPQSVQKYLDIQDNNDKDKE